MITYIVIGIFVLLLAVVIYALDNQEKVIEKAQKSKNMFNFYHILALMTAPGYKGYNSTDEEKKAMEEFLKGDNEYDAHPIGSYFKMRKDNKEICNLAGNFDGGNITFNGSEVMIGVLVMVAFVIVVTLGVMTHN
jgi:hypothetical protein